MIPFWLVLAVIGAVPAYQLGGILGLMCYFAFLLFARGKWMYLFALAGPRTSRQVPPVPIAHCQQLSAQQLSQAYREGTLNCVDVAQTYIDHIRRVNPYINVIVWECFDEALVAAAEAEKTWAAWRKNRSMPMPSWLLGVPCTIKESMAVAGCPNTSGHPNRMHVTSNADSPVVRNFREAGAIILGITNTSELCMWYESSNYVYGISCNPYDTRCLVGGSSGGEGAAAGAAFSTFGVGSDIGGSIRMPAFFNGVYGHKTSPHYISNMGQHPGARSSANHYMTTGPITRFPEDIIPLSQIAARGGFQLDPKVYPPCSPLHRVIDLKKQRRLRVYAIEDFGAQWPVRVAQSQIDAVHKASEALRERYGAEVIYVNVLHPKRCTGGTIPPPFDQFAKILAMWTTALSCDPSEEKFNHLMSEGHGGEVNWFAEVGRWLIGHSLHTLPAISLCLIERLVHSMPHVVNTLMQSSDHLILPFQHDLEQLLGDDGIIIAPTFPQPAPRHHHPLWNPFQFQYTAAFNVLQLPATTVPVWLGEDMVGATQACTPSEARAAGYPADHHLPKGVQIVSASQHDELCVSTAIALKEALGGYRYPGWARLQGIDY